MNKKLLFAFVVSVAATLVLSVSVIAQTDSADAPADTTEQGDVLPAKTLKVARAFSGTLFGGKVVIGAVKQVADKIVTVTQRDGTEADVTTTEVTKFTKGGRKVTLSGLAVGDTVYALGASSIDGTFLAKSIIARSKVLKELKKVPFYGVIDEVGAKSFTLTNQTKSETVEITVNSTTVIKQTGKKITLSAVTSGTRAVVIALKEDSGTYTGKMVQLLPETGPKNASIEQSTESGTPNL